MSLINEALKRTRDTAFGSAGASGAGTAAYRIDSGNAAGRNVGIPLAIVALIVLGNLGLGGWLAWRLHDRQHAVGLPPELVAAVPVRNAPPAVVPPVSPAPGPLPSVAAAPAPGRSAADAPAVSSENAVVAKVLEKIKSEQAAAPAEPAAVELPKLVLQGITRDRHGGEVMINGFTYHEGDDVEGAHVLSIDNESVKLRFGQREFVLRLR